MRRVLFVFLAVALGAAGLLAVPVSAEPSAPINSTNPTSFGDWDVGLHTFEIVDESREGRTFLVDLWYPIDPEATEGAQRAQLELLVTNIELNAFDDPEPAAEGNFPLVVFSHGSGGFRAQSWELMEVMASHGYVVAAPDHTGNTSLDNSDPFLTTAFNRPRDISLVIDTVLEFDRTRGNQFHRTIDQRRIGVSGHSFGGFTALAMAGGYNDFAPDRRVDVIVPIAPAASILSYAELRGVKIPTLLLSGTSDITTPISVNTDYAWDIIRSKVAYRVDILKAGHNSFTNVCELYDALVNAGLPPALLALLVRSAQEGCAPDLIDIDKAHFLTYGYVMAFLDSTIGDQPERSILLSQAIADFFHLPADVSVRPEPPQPIELQENIVVLTEEEIPTELVQQLVDEDELGDPDAPFVGELPGGELNIVKLRGKTNHFGIDIQVSPPKYIDYHATVPDTDVWIAEYPETRARDIETDETGWWTMYVVKDEGVDAEFSFVFEKEGWVTTKTNVNTITDDDDLDFAIQFIDPYYFEVGMLPFVQGMMRGAGYPDFEFENAMVVTVGKSWASMHDDRLPHGDPGATMTISPDSSNLIGPIYFNKSVIPDLTQLSTSVDGGVTWLNMPVDQTYSVSAEKPGVTYPTVKFDITSADVDNGVQLYIASPPDSLEGDNDSPPGDD